MKSALFIALLQVGLMANAAPQKPTTQHAAEIYAEIHFGDAITSYTLKEVGDKATFVKESTNNSAGKGDISLKDYRFIQNKLNSIKKLQSNEKRFCPRSFIIVKNGSDEKIGCINAKTKISKALVDFTNVLKLLN